MIRTLPVFALAILLATSCQNEPALLDSNELIFPDQQFELDKNVAPNTYVGQIQAANMLGGNKIYFGIINNRSPFTIGEATGELLVKNNLPIDFETNPNYDLKVVAYNGSTTSQATITVMVNDNNAVTTIAEEKARFSDYFKHLTLKKDNGSHIKQYSKWITPMKIALSGNFTANDKQTLVDFVKTLNSLTSDGFEISLVNTIEEANTEMYFETRETLLKNKPSFVGMVSTSNAGKTKLSKYTTGEIAKSSIWISTTSTDRVTTIKHELLHAIGFGHSESRSSILYPSSGVTNKLSKDDKLMVKALYHPLLPLGAEASEIDAVLDHIM